MRLNDIHFGPRLPLELHSRYSEVRRLIGLKDFAAYREVFERGWAETSIMCGEFMRLEELPITKEEPPNTPLVNLMGVNQHSPRRVRLAREFFNEYERVGRSGFLKEVAMKTGYGQDLQAITDHMTSGLKGIRLLLAKRTQEKGIKHRIATYLNTYDNMKRFGTLVGLANRLQEDSPPLTPMDIPWAIDYRGYVKLRDGAHRRAAAHYLGWGNMPTLVFEFDRVTRDGLENAHPYIRDNFDWFKELVQTAAALQSTSPKIRQT